MNIQFFKETNPEISTIKGELEMVHLALWPPIERPLVSPIDFLSSLIDLFSPITNFCHEPEEQPTHPSLPQAMHALP